MKKLFSFQLLFIFPIVLVATQAFAQEGKVSGADSKEATNEINRPRNKANAVVGSPNEPSDPATQAIVEEIKAQLATMASKPLMELIEFCKKKEIVGDFVVDLTVEGKGKIVTVFMVSTPEIEMPKKNALKDKLTQLSFDNIKMPKKERVKLRYTFKF